MSKDTIMAGQKNRKQRRAAASNNPPEATESPEAPQEDQEFLDNIARVYGLAQQNNIRAFGMVVITKDGNLVRLAKSDREFTSECMLVTLLDRMKNGIEMEMERRDAKQMADQVLDRQKAVREAAEKVAANESADIEVIEPAGNA